MKAKASTCRLLLKAMAVVMLVSGHVTAEWNESYLIREVLMKDYDPVVRPVLDPADRLYLSMSVGLKSIIQLDMKKQTMISFGWVTVNWYDPFLAWSVQEHPVTAVHLTSDMVWRPELVVFNTVSDLDQLEDQRMKVSVQSDGKVTWFAGGLFETFCSIDISHYPLDTQTCSVDIIPWSSGNDVLNGTFRDPAFDIASMENHPEWTVVGTEAVYVLRPSNFWVLNFRFTLKRKVMFYIINILMPIVLLSLMNCLVFLLPVESGEKMTVSVTVFLSFAVFMSLINDSLPQNSDSLCLFSAYVAVQMFLSVCSIVMAAVIVFIFDRDRDVPPAHPPAPHHHAPPASKRKLSSGSADSGFDPKSLMSSSATMETICGSMNNDHTADTVNGFLAAEGASNSVGKAAGRPGAQGHPYQRSVSTRMVLQMLKSQHVLSPKQRRLLSRSLDKLGFTLTVSINIVSCFTFIALIMFT